MVEPGFDLEDVSFSYGDKPALTGLTVSLPAGCFYGLVGPNGCGKSTLLDLLMGSKQPATGRLHLAGRPLPAYSRRELAQRLALVPQDFAIDFAFTVLEVVLMGRHPYLPRFGPVTGPDMDKAEQAMASLGIAGFRDRYVTELSGGEKQRVVVARALAQDTPVLLLDEATSNLDIGHTLTIMNVARDRVRHRGDTVIAVVHNLNLAAAYCDRLIFLRDGRVADSGPTATVLTAATIQAVFGVEARVGADPFAGALQVSFRYGRA